MLFLSAQRRWLMLASAALVAVGALFLVSCSDGDDDGGDAEVLNAINILDKAGLHDLDESINTDKEIPANALTTARQLQAVTELTEWPDSLQSKADALEKIFEELGAAVGGENPDVAKAGEAAKKAHDAQHDFSHEVWEHLYKEAGVNTGGGDGH